MYMYAEFIRRWRSKCGYLQRDGQVLFNLIYELDMNRETKSCVVLVLIPSITMPKSRVASKNCGRSVSLQLMNKQTCVALIRK